MTCQTLPFEIINSMRSQLSLTNSQSNPPDQQTTKSLLLVAATGLGKTAMMGGLARSWPMGRVMMISHRFELNQQAIQSFEWICREDVDLEQAGYRADQRTQKSRVVVASVQTLTSKNKGKFRMERFHPNDFGLLLIDEAHRSAASSYRRIVEYFSQNRSLKIVGVTATPDRLDGVGLGCIYDEVVGNLDLRWGVENGWLVAPRQVIVELENLDLRDVKTVGGDLDERQLAKVVEAEEVLHGMAKPIVDFAGTDKQAIVFTASVAQAHRLSELIRDYYERTHGTVESTTAMSIDGSMSPQDPRRKQIVKDFKEGGIQFLVNCGVATEGFDAPNVKLVAIGRPTKSRALYVQMLGRGTRPLPGTVEDAESSPGRIAAIAASPKPHCDVLDFIGQSGRHALVCATDVLAGGEPPEVIDRANKISSKQDFDGSSIDAIKEAKEQLEAEAEARRKKVTVGVQYRVTDSGSLFSLSQIPPTYVPGYMQRVAPTPKQRSMLLRLGFNGAQVDEMNPRTARSAIDYAIRNPKTKFGRWIKAQKIKNGELDS